MDRTKYPRTPHLPWSNKDDDDIKLHHSPFKATDEVVITEKLDGENTTMYCDGMHARSLDSKYHWSRSWVKNFWASHVAWKIPDNVRIVGENMYAVHSIRYDALKSYFYGISVWENDICLDWVSTLDYFDSLDIEPVPTIAWGIYEDIIKFTLREGAEGYVVRKAESFTADQFQDSVAKYVHRDFVVGNDHWQHGAIDINHLI